MAAAASSHQIYLPVGTKLEEKGEKSIAYVKKQKLSQKSHSTIPLISNWPVF